MQLEKIRVGHDGRGLGTGWYLEEVVIIIHDECWIFPCNRWLADYEDDGKTERDLYAGEREICAGRANCSRKGEDKFIRTLQAEFELVVFFWTAALVTVLKSLDIFIGNPRCLFLPQQRSRTTQQDVTRLHAHKHPDS